MNMGKHAAFSFSSLDDLKRKAGELGASIPVREDISCLFRPITLAGRRLSNRLAVQPMEGFDACPDGSPGDRTFRRYRRYARGGSSLIWFEAAGVVSDGRSNPNQLMLTGSNRDSFRRLVETARTEAKEALGDSHEVFLILQLTHSGRYSRPNGISAPRTACLNPYLDKTSDPRQVLTDEEILRLMDRFVEASLWAEQAGFDAVDIKSCHGYLVSDLLAAHKRKHSNFGGTFENRTRFLLETVDRIRRASKEIETCVRLSAFDGIPYPFGFGVSRTEPKEPDLAEPVELIRRLESLGCSLINISVGNPALKPHMGRPFDRPAEGSGFSDEHPLEGVSRLLRITGDLQKRFPGLSFVGTGYSWLRQFFPCVGAAVIDRGEAEFIGLGRSSFAYPDAPHDLKRTGRLDPRKVCTACSRCSELTRALHATGCVVRDIDPYGREYKRLFPRRRGF